VSFVEWLWVLRRKGEENFQKGLLMEPVSKQERERENEKTRISREYSEANPPSTDTDIQI